MEQNIEYEPSVRYEADITQGLSQEQVRQRTEEGWTNEAVTASSKNRSTSPTTAISASL